MHSPLLPVRAPAETGRAPEVPTTSPVVSAQVADPIRAKETDARSPEPGTVTRLVTETAPEAANAAQAPFCCLGIDQPGVGFVHAADCTGSPNAVTRFPGEGSIWAKANPGLAAHVPPSLLRLLNNEPSADLTWRQRDSIEDGDLLVALDSSLRILKARLVRREDLLAQLLFAARDLAERNILGKDWEPMPAGAHAAVWCRECQMTEHLGGLQHTGTCQTGRVFGIIGELMSTSDSEPKGKEAAPEGEKGRARDGIRSREPQERAEWIIQRCTQRWVGTELQYEDFPTPEGLMTRTQMLEVLERVARENNDDEFRGHNTRNQPGGAQ